MEPIHMDYIIAVTISREPIQTQSSVHGQINAYKMSHSKKQVYWLLAAVEAGCLQWSHIGRKNVSYCMPRAKLSTKI